MSSATAPRRRVVITGLGVVTPIGHTIEAFWDALVAGRSGVARLESIPPEALPTSFAGEVRDFTGSIDDFGALEGEQKKAIRKGLKLMCRECQMGVAAAMRALTDARLLAGGFNPERAGVVYGSDYMLSMPQEFNAGMELCARPDGVFHYSQWGSEGMRQLSPLWLLKYLPNMPACHIAIYNDLRGPSNSITHREAAANLAVGEAYQTIVRGAAEMMVAGATGTRIHPMKILQVLQQEEAAGNGVPPEQASRPFDRQRSGMVLGEGAGAIVVEELKSAEARGATVYAEIVGHGSSSVASRNSVAHRTQAMANALRATLRSAVATTGEIGHLHAHGLSTRTCDADEARAIREVFDGRADELPITAAKSYFGNLGAGSGIVELAASVLALRHGRLFPILNYETPDPECPVLAVRSADAEPGRSFLNLNVTPQGQASCVMVRALA